MRIIGKVVFPDKVIKYFEMDKYRREIQLEDGSVVNRDKYAFKGKLVDLFEMSEKGSIYTYIVERNNLFMAEWITDIIKVDCLFRSDEFIKGYTYYSLYINNIIYKLCYNKSKKSVIFAGLSINNNFPSVVPIAEVQDFFNLLHKQGGRVREHSEWSGVISCY